MNAVRRVLLWAGVILLALGLWKMTFLIVLGIVVLVAGFIVETAADALASAIQPDWHLSVPANCLPL